MKRKAKTAVPEAPLFRAQRELSTELGRCRWLFDFVRRDDIGSLSQEQVAEMYDYLHAFCRTEGITIEDPGAASLALLQEEARSGLRQSILHEEVGKPVVRGFGVGWEVRVDDVVRHVTRGSCHTSGPLRTLFLSSVADLIAADRDKRIRECARPTCKRLFYKFGRVKYCSKACADADRQMRWRNKEEVPDE
jgi:hypothetical protein